MKTKRTTALILFLLIVLPLAISSSDESKHSQITTINYNEKKDLTQLSDQINIDELDDFIAYGFPGNGTEQNPYIIENYEIRNLDAPGIQIRNIFQYFVIRNCLLVNTGGIYLRYIAPGKAIIIDNFCTTNTLEDQGIHISHSSQTVITNNTCENFEQGIDIDDSNNCIISNNTCRFNALAGITLDSQSFDCILDHNTFQNNEKYGLQYWHCPSSIITNNNFYNDGMYLFGDSSILMNFIVENNTINGLKLGFFKNVSSQIYSIPEYGQIIVVECYNLTFSNQFISNTFYGIAIISSNKITLKNNLITEIKNYGIYIEDSPNCIVNSNTLLDNLIAIGTSESYNSSITDNVLVNTGFLFSETIGDNFLSYNIQNNSVNGKEFGFFFRLSDFTISNNIYGQIILIECSNVKIENQIISHTTYGIFMVSCQNCLVIASTLKSNNMYGLVVFKSENTVVDGNNCSDNGSGILTLESENTHMTNNYLQNNVKWGIFALLSSSLIITNNICEKNGYIISSTDESLYVAGIYIDNCPYSLIENNICRNNKEYGIYCIIADETWINNNTCYENEVGMCIRFSNNIIVEKSKIYSNSLDGLYLAYSTQALIYDNNCTENNVGIRLKASSFCKLTLNFLVNNYDVGAKFESTESCVLFQNNFKNNYLFGLYLDLNSDNSIIYENDFLLNNPDGIGSYASQGYDDGGGNIWFNSTSQKGNYWGKSEDLYSISGTSHSYDLYPLDESIFLENRPIYTEESVYISFVSIIMLFAIIRFRKHKKSL